MFDMLQSILLISPHTDDCEFGMGATIKQFVDAQKHITWVVMSNASVSLPPGFDDDTLIREQKKSAESLGIGDQSLIFYDFPVRNFTRFRQEILEVFVELERENSFDAVFAPSRFDAHQDHSVIVNEAVRAFKKTCIFGYDLPWNYTQQNFGCLNEISEKELSVKLNALKKYESQTARKYMDKSVIEAIARFRALTTKADYCEGFEVIKYVTYKA